MMNQVMVMSGVNINLKKERIKMRIIPQNLKIVHCAIFSEFKYGQTFYDMDRKISHGLIQNGHFVYDFSYRDNEKINRKLGIKNSGISKMNTNLIKLCDNIKPDILLIGKAETVTIETLKIIKKRIPNIKILQWFVDFLATEKEEFFERFEYIDAFFQTTATDLKNLSLKYKKTVFSFFPNISDSSFEQDLSLKKEYDIIYIARDYKEDVRTKFAHLLYDFCKKENLNLKVYGSLNNPPIFGFEYQKEINKSKIAINFNREDKIDDYNKEKILGSSDRMNHFLGNGTCTFSPKIIGMDSLYEDAKEVIYFENVDDCFEKILYYLKENRYVSIGKKGQQKAYNISNSKRVTKFILDVAYNKLDENYEWKEYIYNFMDENINA